MKDGRGTQDNSFIQALEAIRKLALQDLRNLVDRGTQGAMMAHSEIEAAPISQKTIVFYRYLVPWRKDLVSVLATTYRRYFKLALAHLHQTGRDSHKWACIQLQPIVNVVLELIHDWYILACDGENQYVRREATTSFVPGQKVSLPITINTAPCSPPTSWLAPAWLFQISLPLFGIGLMKPGHIPVVDSEQKLGVAHTRLLLKGSRRVFLWDLQAVIERARNEEIAAAGVIPTGAASGKERAPNKRRGWEQRVRLYKAIQNALKGNPSLQGMNLCAELDKRHAPPLFDWTQSGEWREGLTWKEAWGNPRLRRKIRRVRQEAMKAC